MSDPTYIGLTVTGPSDVLKRFKDVVRGDNGVLDFAKVIPIPPGIDPFHVEFRNGGKDADGVTTYQYTPSWADKHWGGTNATNIEILTDTDNEFSIQYDAGDFPDLVMKKLIADFPELQFSGSAFENVDRWYMTYSGVNGNYTEEEGDYDKEFPEEGDGQ